MLSNTDRDYLRQILLEGYADFSGDANALAACNRLASENLCRIVHDGPAWRIFQSPEQIVAGCKIIKISEARPMRKPIDVTFLLHAILLALIAAMLIYGRHAI
jgi:hypothetical protein